VVEARFYLGGRLVATDTTAPFRQLIHPDPGPGRVGARVSLLDGRRNATERRLEVCAGP
jgi:hypothetical protein